MRMLSALRADMKFQFKQGFYTVYLFITIMYMVILSQFSPDIKGVLVPLVVFSDPSMVGFFFIGAIMMLEKVQGVLQYIVITPLRIMEYLLAKVISLTILALLAGIIITITTYGVDVRWFLLITGIALTSTFFVLYGLLAAAPCNTMNQYFIRMIPYMLLVTLPCFSIIPFPGLNLFDLIPSVSGLKMVYGAYDTLDPLLATGYGAYLILFNFLLLLRVEKVFDRMVIGG